MFAFDLCSMWQKTLLGMFALYYLYANLMYSHTLYINNKVYFS